MTLNASGNLSIGNTNDTFKLDVTGTGRFSGMITITGVSEYLRNIQSGTLSQAQTWYASDGTTRRAVFGFRSGDSDNFTLLNERNGSLLIGTNDATNLTIASTGAATFSSSVTSTLTSGIFLNNSSGGTNSTQVRVNNTGGDVRMGVESSTGGTMQIGTSAYSAVFGNQANAATEFTTNGTVRMTILGGGNVGIGTNNPVSLLQVNGESRIIYSKAVASNPLDVSSFSGLITVNTNNINGSLSGIAMYANSDYNAAAGIFASRTSGTSADMVFYAGSATAGERMRITSGGELLVGTTSSDPIAARSSGFAYDNSFGLRLRSAATQINLQLAASSGTNIQFWTDNGTNVAAGSISSNGAVTSYNVTSDYRLKQDFKDYSGLDLVNKIKTYDYEWKADKTRGYGVIAHELQSVINYAVTGVKDGKEMQGVDYSKIVPVLIKAIQEQQTQIEQLKNK
jgi:hypothetical protein